MDRTLRVRSKILQRYSREVFVDRLRRSRSAYANFVAAIVALFIASTVFAQSGADFAKANEEFAQGHFKEAIAGYEALISAGQWNPNLFYDLGNAYFRTKDFGRAILNYERALALDRHHPEATANLQIARDEARTLELQPSLLERYLQLANANQYSVNRGGGLLADDFCVCRDDFRASPIGDTAGVISVLSNRVRVCCVGNVHIDNEGRALAIIIDEDYKARLATQTPPTAFSRCRREVKLRSWRPAGNWTYAALPNDLRGWIPAKHAEQVRL